MAKKHRKSLLFKNSIKQVFKDTIQLSIMIILLVITSFIFMFTIITSQRLTNSLDETNTKSNLHDFVIDLNNTNFQGTKSGHSNFYLNEQSVENDANINNFIADRVDTKKFLLSNTTLKLVATDPSARIDKLVIVKGLNIGASANRLIPLGQQVVIDQGFAKANHIKIGSTIRITPDSEGSSILVHSNILKSG